MENADSSKIQNLYILLNFTENTIDALRMWLKMLI